MPPTLHDAVVRNWPCRRRQLTAGIVPAMPRIPTAAVAAGSLIGGYLVARESGVRPLGGAVLLAGGAWCTREWLRSRGPAVAGRTGGSGQRAAAAYLALPAIACRVASVRRNKPDRHLP